MEATSVIRQGQLGWVAALFAVPLAFGAFWLIAYAVDPTGVGTLVLAIAGAFLVLLSVVMILACLLSLRIRATAGPAGLGSGEIGARWRLGWPEVAHVWFVQFRGETFLAALPAAPSRNHRTSWRSRRLGLPEQTRSVRVDPASVPVIAQVVQAYRGLPPELRAA